jgi:hypothetical protein
MKRIFYFIFLFTFLIAPLVSFAWTFGEPIVPCSGVDCDFNSLIQLINNLVSIAFYIVVPILAITFTYAGFLYLVSGGDGRKVGQAKTIFTRTMWGLIWMFGAWVFVKALAVAFLDSDLPINTFLG